MTATQPGYEKTVIWTPEGFVTGETLATHQPTITGKARQGSTLTANPGPWGPAPVSFAYQWSANGVVIPGATASTYVPKLSDFGKKITVRVYGSKPGYTPTNRTSAPTSAVRFPVLVTNPPIITGTPKMGSILIATLPGWRPTPTAVTYKWTADGVRIAGAESSRLTLTPAQVGKRIVVTVTGTARGYEATTRGSLSTAIVTR